MCLFVGVNRGIDHKSVSQSKGGSVIMINIVSYRITVRSEMSDLRFGANNVTENGINNFLRKFLYQPLMLLLRDINQAITLLPNYNA